METKNKGPRKEKEERLWRHHQEKQLKKRTDKRGFFGKSSLRKAKRGQRKKGRVPNHFGGGFKKNNDNTKAKKKRKQPSGSREKVVERKGED